MNDERLRWRPDDDPRVSRDELEAELGHVVARGRRRRARRTAVVGSSLALLVVLVAAATLRNTGESSGLRAADRGSTTTTVDDGEAVTTTLVPTTSTTTAPHPRPPFVVVARKATGGTSEQGEEFHTELAVLDADTGKDVRILRRTVFLITEVRLSPDGKHVYFVEGDCGFEVMRVRVDGPVGQEPEHLVTDGESEDPALSSDGRFLAYMGEGACDPEIMELRIRELASRAERVVATETRDYELGSMSWSSDGTALAVTVRRSTDNGNRTTESFIAVLDPTTNQDVSRAPRITSSRRGFGFFSPTYLPDGSLFVIESPLTENGEPDLMLVVDARTGQTLRRVATGDPRRAYGRTATDVTGSHLLYVSTPRGEAGLEGGELRVSSNGGRTTVLARNVMAADW